jgi:RecB family exonuclease
VQIPSAHVPGQIELLGWLELPLDMAPALVATSFNEGCVPTSVNSDLFLPNALRQQLELLDNRRRYARDAYALSVLLASRQELTLIAGRQTADGDPLTPSRLAFATDPETAARRALEFFRADESAEPNRHVVRAARGADKSGFVVRRPARLERPVTTIGVTAFRSYLACPYRFYLRHVLQLDSMDDAAEELGPDTFGTLLHEVLRQFGNDPIRAEADPDKIRRFLHHALNRYVTANYGTNHLPALAVQIVQAQTRLDAFADWQADRTKEGWEIKHVETSGGAQPACLNLDGGVSITLRGRIDRIDHRDGHWAILDYKTGDSAKTPQETHLKSKEWVDLQLPLYIKLAQTLDIEGPMQLGYIVLPKDVAKVGALMADWDDTMLAAADQRAIEVAQSIYNQEFWPPKDRTPDILTEYAAICQDQAFRRNLEDDTRRETIA